MPLDAGARGCAKPLVVLVGEASPKPWRHLDQGGVRCRIECRLRRLYSPGCGDVYEMVPWARAGSSYTRDFDDLSALAGAADEPDAAHQADADRLGDGWEDRGAGR